MQRSRREAISRRRRAWVVFHVLWPSALFVAGVAWEGRLTPDTLISALIFGLGLSSLMLASSVVTSLSRPSETSGEPPGLKLTNPEVWWMLGGICLVFVYLVMAITSLTVGPERQIEDVEFWLTISGLGLIGGVVMWAVTLLIGRWSLKRAHAKQMRGDG
ncbi:MAG: hypothetical protein HKN29_06290 [Rhodothermales bacterium]|nr:hypothetical protein [Rhodothermales bacterium]